ncbi:bifunctional DNA primase/polymerase [Actinoalloteichus hymeniacidonis]|uniref:Bifunctional DNA primase/polymerase famiily protein n=1 Tax=Actinoalloteichus hymeniacidonis TaxID=340345 RepID=A0AAC9HUX7_9PSEU|nr:bifunctional DNA primase/polymerase famiily protein [Actinoalloteichus hymeniacidonis]MBB5906923.1 hypothetical protein [Actinoalloteichus hymeniacidonis]
MTGDIRSALRSAATSAAERFGPVFPLRAPKARHAKRPAWGLHADRDCDGTGYCRTGHLGWEDLATADTERVARCWSNFCRLGSGVHNIGLPCGLSGLLVVDCDMPKGPDDRPEGRWTREGVGSGLDMLTALAQEVGEQPPLPGDTFTVRTPSGGTHLYYRMPSGVRLGNTASALGWRIDTRGWGGYVAAPGSMVTDTTGTRRYEVEADVPILDLPAWITRRLADRPRETLSAAPQMATDRLDRYVVAAVRGECARVAEAPPGAHAMTLFTAAMALGRLAPSLPPGTAHSALTTAAAGYLDSGCDCTTREIDRNIRNGLTRATVRTSR